MLPFTTTKIGPGDKTKAYVVRQNVCLKIMLFSFAAMVAMLIVLSSTLYEVHIERRTSARNAGVHRREEHALRMQVGRLGMRLQQHMKDDVRDMSILREYRARMYRAVGEYQNAVRLVVEDATGRNATLSSELTRLELELDEQLEHSMKQLWSDVNDEGRRASDVLRNLTAEILVGFKHDAREAVRGGARRSARRWPLEASARLLSGRALRPAQPSRPRHPRARARAGAGGVRAGVRRGHRLPRRRGARAAARRGERPS